jgi:hypothetical protein
MKFRKLRFALSAFCGLAAVLLVLLWVRSYYACDTIHVKYRAWHYAWIVPERGRIVISLSEIKSILSGFAIDHIEVTKIQFPIIRHTYWVHVLRMGNLTEIYVPIWLPILFLATLAAGPWVRFRFTLRTLLVAITLISLLLGLIVMHL